MVESVRVRLRTWGRRMRGLTFVFLLLAVLLCGALAEPCAAAGFWVPPAPPRAQYDIDARLTIQDHRGVLEATERVRLENDANRPIEELALLWPLGTAEVGEVRADGQVVAAELVEKPGTGPLLVFRLPAPCAPGSAAVVDTSFTHHWPRWPDDGMLLTEWYPGLWWGFPTHDDYAVRLDAPSDFVVGASGRLDPSSGRYVLRGAKSFGLFLSREHEVLEGDAGEVHIRVVHTGEAEACARLLLETAVDVVGFYRERFGFYPHPCLTVLPGADRPMGGYPAATALVVVHGQEKLAEKPEGFWRWITAHEIAHQYWGDHVLERETPGWLWIGLGLYTDRGYARARGIGSSHHQGIMGRYKEGVESGFDTTLAATPERIARAGFDWNNVAKHGKGYSVISALAVVLGSETLDRICDRCLEEFAGRRLGPGAFQDVCEEEAGQDLSWFFDQWVRSNRFLSYRIAGQDCVQEAGRYLTRVQVQCAGTLEMPVPVAARFEDGSEQRQVTDRLLSVQELTFESHAPLVEVRIDPDGDLAMAEGVDSEAARELAARLRDLPLTGAGRAPFDLFFMALDLEIEDVDLWVKLALMLYDGEFYEEALKAFGRVAELADEGSPWAFAALVWQGHIFDLNGEREQAVARYQAALERDTGQSVSHDQYGMTIDRAWVQERIETPFARE